MEHAYHVVVPYLMNLQLFIQYGETMPCMKEVTNLVKLDPKMKEILERDGVWYEKLDGIKWSENNLTAIARHYNVVI